MNIYLYELKSSTKSQMENFVSLLVIGNTAVDHCLLAGVHNNKWQMDDRIGRWRSVCLLFCLTVSLDEVLKGNLLEKATAISRYE